MKKKERQSPEKSLKNVKKKSRRSRSLYKIRKKALPNVPNIRLRLHLKENGLTMSTCEDLRKVLKLEQTLTDSKVQIAHNFYRYKWELRVRNPRTFKRALAEYQRQHPDIDIFCEDLKSMGSYFQYLTYAGAVSTLLVLFI